VKIDKNSQTIGKCNWNEYERDARTSEASLLKIGLVILIFDIGSPTEYKQ